ncbi:Retrovirus-related Pol polyprotein [Thelohanellus kitauei]|uniref:Retrovirus-related Pol polyprotein n=1 Tax=Thelohanellus kitauei TaxID=669202 RepID=A0A0C2MK23_THEKT|nr:Retrovirus-related Pol polyprotein [Thelohanellus kitauei]
MTKWIEAFAVPDMKAETAAKLVVDKIVCRFCVPISLHSDQGRQFESLLFLYTCEIFGIHKTHSTTYHPQGNGIAERAIRTLKELLRNIMNQKKTELDESIDLALMTIRTTVNDTALQTPFTLVYGRKPRTINSHEMTDKSRNENLHTFTDELEKKVRDIESRAKEKIAASQSKYNHYYDNTYSNTFWPGSWVRVRNATPSALSVRYSQPIRIVKEQTPGTYLLYNATGKQFLIHHNRLKAHHIDPRYDVLREDKRAIHVR